MSPTDSKVSDLFRYSRKNPPSSVEAAKNRLDDLAVDIENIVAQLEFKTSEDFMGDEVEYARWQKSAIKALAHKRGEYKFVEGWLAKPAEGPKPEQKAATPSKENSPIADPQIEELRDMVDCMVADIASRYTAVYSSTKKPTSEMDALRRVIIVKKFLNECEDQFEGVNLRGRELGIGEKRLSSPKKSLVKLRAQILDEHRCIAAYMRDNNLRVNWHKFMLEIIERGEKNLIVLDEREQLILDNIRADIR